MYVRQVKRKCNVRGCKNTECFAISQTREVGNTVIICKSCLSLALESLDEINPKTKSNISVIENKAVPSLFFNAAALGQLETKDDLTADAAIVKGNLTEAEDKPCEVFACPNCGKEFDSVRGLRAHTRYCESQNKE